MMSILDNRVTATVNALSPKDVNGQPVFGADNIVFNISGLNENGVIKGEYKSVVESGTFVLCSPEAIQNGYQCDTPPIGNPLGGLLNVLRALSRQ
jgi:hypothetical protein